MMHCCEDITAAIGMTPLVRIRRLVGTKDAMVLAKAEFLNPGGAIKARTALGMIEHLERQGVIKPGATLIESSTGNQGIAVSMIAAARGYRAIVTLPAHYGGERVTIMKAYGAEVVLRPPGKDMEDTMLGGRAVCEQLVREIPGAVWLQQFSNPGNPAAHRATTGAEILQQTGGRIDAFVAGIGTGGTFTGVVQVLKQAVPGVKAYLVEPENAALEGKGKVGFHKQQGIGDGIKSVFVPHQLVDGYLDVSDEDALDTARALARQEGIFVGPSSGTAMSAALRVARELGQEKVVVTILPDTGERYLSTGMWDVDDADGDTLP